MPATYNASFTCEKLEALYPGDVNQSELRFKPNITVAKGTVLGQVTSANANEVQTLTVTGTPTGGTFKISISGVDGGTYESSSIAYNATAATVATAVRALLVSAGYGTTAQVSTTGVVGSGGALPGTAVVLTFGGIFAAKPMPLMTVTSAALTGGTTPAGAIAQTTAGITSGVFAAYSDSASDGTQTAVGIAVYDFRTDYLGRVVFGTASTPPENGIYSLTAPAYFKGRFRTSELTGLDANGIADLGRLESGTSSDGVLALI